MCWLSALSSHFFFANRRKRNKWTAASGENATAVTWSRFNLKNSICESRRVATMMWGMIPNEIKSSIFYYKSGVFEEIKHDVNDTCEDVCRELCRRWRFPPLVQLLFGLRLQGKNLWLAGCRQLKEGVKYEFRIRFKVSWRRFLKWNKIKIN